MWHEISTEQDLRYLMEKTYGFHDSCLKELSYVSGAYVDDELWMRPVNDQRSLRVVIQRQFKEDPVIELEFSGLHHLLLRPVDESYTCEILDATLLLTQDRVYWCDCGGLTEETIPDYHGTVICASKLRWRSIPR